MQRKSVSAMQAAMHSLTVALVSVKGWVVDV